MKEFGNKKFKESEEGISLKVPFFNGRFNIRGVCVCVWGGLLRNPES